MAPARVGIVAANEASNFRRGRSEPRRLPKARRASKRPYVRREIRGVDRGRFLNASKHLVDLADGHAQLGRHPRHRHATGPVDRPLFHLCHRCSRITLCSLARPFRRRIDLLAEPLGAPLVGHGESRRAQNTRAWRRTRRIRDAGGAIVRVLSTSGQILGTCRAGATNYSTWRSLSSNRYPSPSLVATNDSVRSLRPSSAVQSGTSNDHVFGSMSLG